MFAVGYIIDNKYRIVDFCQSIGGMGTIIFVKDIMSDDTILVLKYCNKTDSNTINRFRREVRIMQTFKDNSYVVPIISANLDHNPPYFVMPYFEYGDLTGQIQYLRQDLQLAEQYFNHMITCIEQLHSKNIFHRDIKPQNFLLAKNALVVSDLGLCTEEGSPTAFTHSSVYGGTPGYIPPEFLDGGFSNADAAGDIFMLGVTFSSILCGAEGPLHPAILAVIKIACNQNKAMRYQSLHHLRQNLKMAFDVALGRNINNSYSMLNIQQNMVDSYNSGTLPNPTDIDNFIYQLYILNSEDKFYILRRMKQELFILSASLALNLKLLNFLIEIYSEMTINDTYDFSFAEVIARNMAIFFKSPNTSDEQKASSLKIAIIAADRKNRFAAMDICTNMITSVQDHGLAQHICYIITHGRYEFLKNINPLHCHSPQISAAINQIKNDFQ